MTTIQTAWEYGRSQLQNSPTPKLDARLLLQHVLNVSHSHLIAHREEKVAAETWQTYQQLVQRAEANEPIPYILGTAPFFNFDLAVTTAVLIPRPETEEIVTKAVAHAQRWEQPRIVDVGTGSGCIAIALAHFLPQAVITAVDISPAALTIAARNAESYVPERITFCQGSLLEPLDAPVDILVANLPYVTTAEWTALDDGVKLFEPRLALDGGVDGLDLVRELLHQAVAKVSETGVLLFEIGWQQGAAAAALARQIFPTAAVQIAPDLTGRDRFLIVERA